MAEPPCCAKLPEEYRPQRHITIRLSTPEERRYLAPPLPGASHGAPPVTAGKYLGVFTDDLEARDNWPAAFFMPVGGRSKAEAVFWAERWASKNDGHFIRPPGWEKVKAHLPERADAG